MGLLKTRVNHEATVAVTTSQQKRLVEEYSEGELSELGEQAIDVDGWMERLVGGV